MLFPNVREGFSDLLLNGQGRMDNISAFDSFQFPAYKNKKQEAIQVVRHLTKPERIPEHC